MTSDTNGGKYIAKVRERFYINENDEFDVYGNIAKYTGSSTVYVDGLPCTVQGSGNDRYILCFHFKYNPDTETFIARGVEYGVSGVNTNKKADGSCEININGIPAGSTYIYNKSNDSYYIGFSRFYTLDSAYTNIRLISDGFTNTTPSDNLFANCTIRSDPSNDGTPCVKLNKSYIVGNGGCIIDNINLCGNGAIDTDGKVLILGSGTKNDCTHDMISLGSASKQARMIIHSGELKTVSSGSVENSNIIIVHADATNLLPGSNTHVFIKDGIFGTINGNNGAELYIYGNAQANIIKNLNLVTMDHAVVSLGAENTKCAMEGITKLILKGGSNVSLMSDIDGITDFLSVAREDSDDKVVYNKIKIYGKKTLSLGTVSGYTSIGVDNAVDMLNISIFGNTMSDGYFFLDYGEWSPIPMGYSDTPDGRYWTLRSVFVAKSQIITETTTLEDVQVCTILGGLNAIPWKITWSVSSIPQDYGTTENKFTIEYDDEILLESSYEGESPEYAGKIPLITMTAYSGTLTVLETEYVSVTIPVSTGNSL